VLDCAAKTEHQLLEILALARRTRRRLALAGQELDALMAAAAFIFKKRHRSILALALALHTPDL
jgi:hypothetical protein